MARPFIHVTLDRPQDFQRLVKQTAKAGALLRGPRMQSVLEDLAHRAKEHMAGAIRSGGQGWPPLSEVTRAIKGHARPLVDSGKMLAAISAWREGSNWYAGIPPGATGNEGRDLNLIAGVHEEGAHIPVTSGVRAFFIAHGFPLRADTKFVRIPARPWFGPAVRDLDQHVTENLPKIMDAVVRDIGLRKVGR